MSNATEVGTLPCFCKSITSVVLPALLYAIEAWYPPNEKDQKKLERVLKFAARLVTNIFISTTTYEELLEKLNWHPMSLLVAIRRLILIKKYMDAPRHIPDCVFPLRETNVNRYSQRIAAAGNSNSLMVHIFRDQKNAKEDKLAGAQLRQLWNALGDDLVRSRLQEFKETVMSNTFINWLKQSDVLNVVCV